MSHNVTLAGVKIRDLTMLGSVVADISKGKAKLVKGLTKFRTYSGQPDDCHHVISMPDLAYDIGVMRQKDGSFALVGDFTLLAMTSHLRAKGQPTPNMFGFRGSNPADFDQQCARFAVGALMQEYVLRQAEEQAALSGRKTERIVGKNGVIALEVV